MSLKVCLGSALRGPEGRAPPGSSDLDVSFRRGSGKQTQGYQRSLSVHLLCAAGCKLRGEEDFGFHSNACLQQEAWETDPSRLGAILVSSHPGLRGCTIGKRSSMPWGEELCRYGRFAVKRDQSLLGLIFVCDFVACSTGLSI